MDPVIPLRWRLALFAKSLLLLGVAGLFAAVAVAGFVLPGRSLFLRVGWMLMALPLTPFLFWAATLGITDAFLGRAVRATGAVALASRRAGHSLQLPSGRYVEHVLWNVWEPLTPQASYTVTYARHSGVLVARPEPEPT